MKKQTILTAAALLVATPAFAADPITGGDVMGAIALISISLATYFLPAIIAFSREHQHRVPILLVNLFLGWTVLGWVAALVWAAMPVIKTSKPPPLPL